MKIALVTDSTADIPIDLLHRYGIHVIPNVVIIDGKSYQDGIDLSRTDFYNHLPEMQSHPTTATASPGRYQQLYEKLFGEGADKILSIHVSKKLSGVFNAASAAAQDFDNRVLVIDSQQLTLGLGFQVLAAAKSVRNGSPLEVVLKAIEDASKRVRVIAMLDTLKYVHLSGRVSWARAQIGNILHVKPFVEVHNGEVSSLGQTRTRNKGIANLLQLMRNSGPMEQAALLHTNAESDARYLLDQLDPVLAETALIVNVTPTIGTHVGPNGLGFAALLKER